MAAICAFRPKTSVEVKRPSAALATTILAAGREPLCTRDARSLVAQPEYHTLRGSPRGPPVGPTGFEPVTSAFGGQRRGLTAWAISLTSCSDGEERTGVRFEKERVYGYSGGATALPGRPLAPAIAPIRGSRR